MSSNSISSSSHNSSSTEHLEAGQRRRLKGKRSIPSHLQNNDLFERTVCSAVNPVRPHWKGKRSTESTGEHSSEKKRNLEGAIETHLTHPLAREVIDEIICFFGVVCQENTMSRHTFLCKGLQEARYSIESQLDRMIPGTEPIKNICVEALVLLATFYREIEKHEKSVHLFHRVIQIDPINLVALEMIAFTYIEQEKLNDALKIYNLIIETNSNTMILMKRAHLFETLGHLSDAINDYKAILKLEPNDSAALVDCAILYEKVNQPERAIHHYNLAVRSNHAKGNAFSNGFALGRLAKIHSDLGQFENAIHFYHQYFPIMFHLDPEILSECIHAYQAAGKDLLELNHQICVLLKLQPSPELDQLINRILSLDPLPTSMELTCLLIDIVKSHSSSEAIETTPSTSDEDSHFSIQNMAGRLSMQTQDLVSTLWGAFSGMRL